MIPEDWKPSNHIIALRRTFVDLLKPGRRVTETAYSHVIGQMNTCVELARELEDESLVLESQLRSHTFPAPATYTGNVTPLRPRLRLVASTPDGGDAA